MLTMLTMATITCYISNNMLILAGIIFTMLLYVIYTP